MKKYNKRYLILGILLFLTIITLVLGLTYAFFSVNIEGNEDAEPTVVDTTYLRLVFNDTQIITLENALPGASASKTFTVTNTGDRKLKYDINIIDVYNTFQNDELVYSLTSTNNGAEITNAVLPSNDGALVDRVEIIPGVTHEYTMTVKFKETGENQNYNQGAEFRGKLQINSSTVYSENITFEIESSAGELIIGENKEITLQGIYYGDVNCESQNPDIAECSAEQNKIIVEGKSRGLANLLITEDIKNTELIYTVRIMEPVLGLSETSGVVFLTSTKQVDITGQDYGTLSCESSNTSIANCSISGNTLNIISNASGTATIKVKDNQNLEVSYSVTVKEVTLSLITSKEEINVEELVTANITGSNYGTLSCQSSNTNIAICSISGTSLRVTGKGIGSATITLKENNLNKTATYNVVIKKTVYNKMLFDNTLQSDSRIVFNTTNGNGLFYTQNYGTYGEDGIRIYYYRGRVDNNWIYFGGFKWRIVRTTSEGGVKLAYSGDGYGTSRAFINTSAEFNSNSNNNKYYVGYTYNASSYTGVQTNSNVKTVIDSWYNKYLKTNYSGYLSTTAIYCAARNIERVDGNYIYFPASDRRTRPSFACPSTNESRYTASTESGNGYLTNPIALLTVDEVVYAGIIYNISGLNSYMMDNATGVNYWWLLSPYYYYSPSSQAGVFSVKSDGAGSYSATSGSWAVRPAVSLKSCVTVTSGNGTLESPYMISNSSC